MCTCIDLPTSKVAFSPSCPGTPSALAKTERSYLEEVGGEENALNTSPSQCRKDFRVHYLPTSRVGSMVSLLFVTLELFTT